VLHVVNYIFATDDYDLSVDYWTLQFVWHFHTFAFHI